TSPSRGRRSALASFIVAAILWPGIVRAGSARDYLNAPVDTWLLSLNAGYTTSVTPEDGTDTIPGVRSNVFAQSAVLTRVMDFFGRTGSAHSSPSCACLAWRATNLRVSAPRQAQKIAMMES